MADSLRLTAYGCTKDRGSLDDSGKNRAGQAGDWNSLEAI